MKTIGLIGGMSWESSAEYYRLINEGVKARLGGLHSADCLMYSFDFAEIEALQMAGDWETATQWMIDASRLLERGGAACIVICTNTMHRMADAVQAAVDRPLIHIADPTAAAIQAAGITRIGLLGTRFTMEGDFYRGRLERVHGLEVLVPDDVGREIVHRIIYDELVLGDIRPGSRKAYLEIIDGLEDSGAQGVILGCTEIGLLIQQAHTSLPVFDTTRLHALAAVDFALEDE
jgi:aspartate racemase